MGKLSFYQDEPLFGLDFGRTGLKLMQLTVGGDKIPRVLGYGFGSYPAESIKKGVITEQATVAAAFHKTLDSGSVGAITARRVACALPTIHTFSRPMQLPAMAEEDITEAVKLEAEQYIPIPISNLYLDYEISHRDERNIELLMVATPKSIIDSYLTLFESLGIEPIALEPAINAASRLFHLDPLSKNGTSIIIDIGSVSTDIAVFANSVSLNSTVDGGGDTMAELIAKHLDTTIAQAHSLKNEHGLNFSNKQMQIAAALQPLLDSLIHEVRKIMRYYVEHGKVGIKPINQIVVIGGSVNMPGLSDYLKRELRLSVQPMDPWSHIDFGGLQPLSQNDRSRFITAAGLAILNPREIF